ncbi:hypothetical protein TH61_02965 [Rufibacter sp. DG15C]|nr:hypothetical protein TH61_02965 [Rufibacter sp. DG15C]
MALPFYPQCARDKAMPLSLQTAPAHAGIATLHHLEVPRLTLRRAAIGCAPGAWAGSKHRIIKWQWRKPAMKHVTPAKCKTLSPPCPSGQRVRGFLILLVRLSIKEKSNKRRQ